jgi:predicted nucleic acid-binding protein
MLLLDSSVLIELEREVSGSAVGPVRTYLGQRRGEDLACSTVSVGELASGSSETIVRVLLRRVLKIPVSEAIGLRAGELDKRLRQKGKRLGENDNWIAATALHYSATLVYIDGDFDRVDGMKRVKLELP